MTALRQALLIAGKDLRIEATTRRSIITACVLGALIVVVLALGFAGVAPEPGASASRTVGALWAAFLFAGTLLYERSMSVERQDDAFDAVLMAPVDRGAIFAGKLLANLALMVMLAVVVVPVGIVLLRLDLDAASALHLGAIMTLSLLGLGAIGTLFAILCSTASSRPGLVAAAVLPLTLPLILASTQLAGRAAAEPIARGLGVLAAFDTLLLVAAWLVGEIVLEP